MKIKDIEKDEVIKCAKDYERDGDRARCLQKFPWLPLAVGALGVGSAAGSLIQDSAESKKMQKSGPEGLKRQITNYLKHDRDPRYLSPGMRDILPSIVSQTEEEVMARKKLNSYFKEK